MAAARVVLVTAPPRRARSLARELVRRRLAACANLVPGVASFYRWKGKVEEARETLLVLKTTARALPALEAAVKELHPYSVPEAIALPVVRGLPEYLRWVNEATRTSHSPRSRSARQRSRSSRCFLAVSSSPMAL